MKMILVLASLMLLAVPSVHGQCTDVPNCSACEDRGPECITCLATKVLSNDKQSCLDCPDNCAKCELKNENDELTCLECSSGYLQDGECTDCELDNCMTCTREGDEETCTKCDDTGYSLSGGECKGCPTGKYLDGTSCKNCPSNSVSCTTGPSVTACEQEGVSYVKAEDGKSCLPCSGCAKCALEDSAAKCTECDENKYLNEGSCAWCAGDSALDKNCKTCGDDGVCTECNTKYYLKDGTCAHCPANCDECSEDENGEHVCGTCSAKYGVNEEVICDACSSNCITCTDSTTCTACDEGYVVVSGVCKACPTKCKTCQTDLKTCTSCLGNEDLGVNAEDDVQCYDLPDGCTDLITDPSAVDGTVFPQCASDACSAGYAHGDTDNQCKACDGTGGVTGCALCSIATGTTTIKCTPDSGSGDTAVIGCKTGYGQWDTGSGVLGCALCTDVTANCLECTPSAANAGTCTKCKDGYGKLGAGADTTCVSCTTGTTGAIANCKECTVGAGPAVTQCDTCDDGFKDANSGAVCVSCTSGTTNAIANCKTCTLNGAENTVTQCDACMDGYTAEGTTACEECDISNCDTCVITSGAAVCNACATGYRKKDGKCTKCTDNCDVCETNADGDQKCTDCANFYKLANDACEACPANCIKCDSATCNNCEPGYGLTEDGNSCAECISNCKACDANTKCTTCDDKYYKEDEKCVSCPGNCLECSYNSGIMECSKCSDGYVPNAGNCDKCPSNCKECSSATKCKTGKCNDGYAVEANECQACATLTEIPNCARCSEKPDANSSAPCLACSSGFALKDNLQSGDGAECVPYSLNCQGGAVADRPFQCDDGKCTGETTQTDKNLCGRECYVCGDYDNDGFVPAEDCKTDNTSGVVTLCPSGSCAMKSRTVEGKKRVAGGCLPVTEDPCANSNVDCKSINEGEEKLLQCTKCCDTNLCLQEDLAKGLDENFASANSANLLMLVSCSVGTLTLLLSRA